MWKTKTPIPFGDDTLSPIVPVKWEADARTGVIHLYPGFAVETPEGLVLGLIEETEDGGQQVTAFPGPEIQLTITDDPNDALLAEAMEDMARGLDKLMQWSLQKLQTSGETRTFRVGRTVYPLDLEWMERDPQKHRTLMEKKSRPPKEEKEPK